MRPTLDCPSDEINQFRYTFRRSLLGNLIPAQVRTAVRYYGDFREEVDQRIAFNREEAARQRAAWERARDALA
jgi:hypothetical protein